MLEVDQSNRLIVPRGRNTTEIQRETTLSRKGDKASLGGNVFWFAKAQLEALFLAASLLVVRREGYRLTARDSP